MDRYLLSGQFLPLIAQRGGVLAGHVIVLAG